jgi:hypothetical protein
MLMDVREPRTSEKEHCLDVNECKRAKNVRKETLVVC